MEATYYKDTMRSYMIIPCPEEAETENYQYRMLEMNRITGLLPADFDILTGCAICTTTSPANKACKVYERKENIRHGISSSDL